MRIVQISDIHVGTEMFRPDLLEAVIEETNAYEPDLVAVAGDLTTSGHRREFEEATTAKLYPGFDEYVRYYELPF